MRRSEGDAHKRILAAMINCICVTHGGFAMINRVGLDIYVGSLTRYYAGDWELVSQKAARAMGVPMEVIRLNETKGAVRDPEEILPAVLAWREGLSLRLQEYLAEPLDWDEGSDAAYFTDKPTWDCYSDLMLWAAYSEQPDLPRPINRVADWSKDEAYKACTAKDFDSRYLSLYDVALWLPCPFDFVFTSEDVAGHPVRIASSVTLVRELQELNRQTWQADADQLNERPFDRADPVCPLEIGARFAHEIFLRLALHSAVHRLPMRLDW